MSSGRRDADRRWVPLLLSVVAMVLAVALLLRGSSLSDLLLELPRGTADPIRVNLTTRTRTARLKVVGPYVIRDLSTGEMLHQGDDLPAAALTADVNSLGTRDLRWHASHFEIVPAREPSLWLNDRLYRGRLRIHRLSDDAFVAVNVLPLEEYLVSVVASEMPSTFPEAAQEAQAIAARSYASYRRAHADRDSAFDVYATVRSQSYLGVEYYDRAGRRLAGETAKSRAAVTATRGQILHWQNQPFLPYYSAACGGRTTRGSDLFPDAAACHTSIDCTGCRGCRYYRWQSRMTLAEFETLLRRRGALSAQSSFTPEAFTITGGAAGQLLQLTTRQTQRTTTGDDLRTGARAGVLLSPKFTFAVHDHEVHFQGEGHGHGVGLCQWGAAGLAAEGRSAIEILRHYYSGCEVVSKPGR